MVRYKLILLKRSTSHIFRHCAAVMRCFKVQGQHIFKKDEKGAELTVGFNSANRLMYQSHTEKKWLRRLPINQRATVPPFPQEYKHISYPFQPARLAEGLGSRLTRGPLSYNLWVWLKPFLYTVSILNPTVAEVLHPSFGSVVQTASH